MNFDIRIPIGAMFSILGVLLVGYGAFADDDIYRRSFDINLNLLWGGVLLLFGVVIWVLGRRGARLEAAQNAGAPGTAAALGAPPAADSSGRAGGGAAHGVAAVKPRAT